MKDKNYNFPIVLTKKKSRTYFKCEPMDDWFTFFNEYDTKNHAIKEKHIITRNDIDTWVSNKISFGYEINSEQFFK